MEKKAKLTNETISTLKEMQNELNNLKKGELKVKNLKVVFSESKDKVYITAYYHDYEELPKLKDMQIVVGTKFNLVRNIVKNIYQKLKEDWERTITREDDYNDYYVTETGDTYTLDEYNNRKYDNGLIYGYDPETNRKVTKIWLEDEETQERILAEFIDEEQGLLIIPGDSNVYRLNNGYLTVVENIDYIPNRR